MILLLLALAFLLRFYQLSSLPPSLDWDEASTGYNAYSILKTGRDEFGQSYPFLFRAFDGYVPPVLVYLNVVSISLLGLNEFAVRVPNALLGTMTTLGLYLLAHELTLSRKFAGIAALFLAISPWHITYSRVNFFATLPVFFVVFGTYFFVLSMKKKNWLWVSAIFFVLAIFSYFSAYVFVPVFALGLMFLFRNNFNLLTKSLFLGVIFMASIYIFFLAGGGQARFKGVLAISDADIVKRSANLILEEGFRGNIVHNRRFTYSQKFLEGYFANFRYDFLFGKFDNVSRMIVPGDGFGLMLLVDLPLLLFGSYKLILKRDFFAKVMLLWLATAPVATAPTLPQMVSTRAILMVVPLAAISAYGFWSFSKVKPIVRYILVMLISFNFLIFAHNYFGHFPKEKAKDWFWGYRELFDYLDNPQNKSSNVHFVFKNHENLDQVYMFNLFYRKVDPLTWQKNGGTKLGCSGTTGQFSFERYDFIPVSCLSKPVNIDEFESDDLVVLANKLEEEPIKSIDFPDKTGAFFIYRWSEVKDSITL